MSWRFLLFSCLAFYRPKKYGCLLGAHGTQERGSQNDKLDVSPSFIMIAFSMDSINIPGIGFPSVMDGCTIAG